MTETQKIQEVKNAINAHPVEVGFLCEKYGLHNFDTYSAIQSGTQTFGAPFVNDLIKAIAPNVQFNNGETTAPPDTGSSSNFWSHTGDLMELLTGISSLALNAWNTTKGGKGNFIEDPLPADQPQQPQQNNTLMYVGGGIVLLVVVLIIILVLKK